MNGQQPIAGPSQGSSVNLLDRLLNYISEACKCLRSAGDTLQACRHHRTYCRHRNALTARWKCSYQGRNGYTSAIDVVMNLLDIDRSEM